MSHSNGGYDPDLNPPVLIDPGQSTRGSHRIATAMKCIRRFGLTYDMPKAGNKRKDNVYLVRGSLFHQALAHHYAPDDGVNYMTPVEAVKAKARKEKGMWCEELPLILDTYHRYRAEFPTERHKVIGVEKELRVTLEDEQGGGNTGLPSHYLYTQRVDMITEYNGQVWYWDHKTTGAQAKFGYWDQFRLNPQFLGYQMLGHHLHGKDFGGVMINSIQFPIKRIKFNVERRRLKPAPHSVGLYRQSVVYMERQIETLRRDKVPPQDWPAQPRSGGCDCAFEKVCWYGRD